MMRGLVLGAVTGVAAIAPPASAVIVAGPQGRNLTAPAGALAASGWDLQGRYGDFLGTPVAADWFITARHFGDAGDVIALADGDHALTGVSMPINGTDLVLRQVATPFSSYAAIYNPTLDGVLTAADRMVVFGRGTARGSVIAGKGWEWGTSDHRLSWGTNDFAAKITITAEDAAAGSGFAVGSSFIAAGFDNSGGDEAALSVGDSGGGVFVYRDGQWKLAAINYGVELFRTQPNDGDLLAAVYDARGLYAQNDDGTYAYVDPATTAQARPQYWYASFVPDALGLIPASPIAVPEPAGAAIGGLLAFGMCRRRRVR